VNKEIDYLKEHLYEIYKYKKSMKDLTYDMDLEHLLRTCKALDYSQKEINRLNNIINELIEEYINYMNKKDFAKKCNISRPYLDKLLKKMNRKEIYEFCKIRNKLRGDNK
jgi:redox-regulated HSP33 family molecular chaperone